MIGAIDELQSGWTRERAALLAVLCLVAGLAVGWFLPPLQTSSTALSVRQSAPLPPAATGSQGDAADAKSQVDAQASQLLEKLKTDPENFDLLTSLGNLYYDARQYTVAIDYYGRALKTRPSDASVRTDRGTALWYLGESDSALAEFDLALHYAPNNPNTLFNRGLVRWQGKKDAAGAIADWEQLLTSDPNYEGKSNVQQMLADVKRQSGLK